MYNEYVLIVIVFDLIFTDSDRDSIFHRLFTFLSVQFFLVILLNIYVCFIIFFFQAEDGIRDIGVTGVQTCALPICLVADRHAPALLEAEGLVEDDRAVDVTDAVAGMDELHAAKLAQPHLLPLARAPDRKSVV